MTASVRSRDFSSAVTRRVLGGAVAAFAVAAAAPALAQDRVAAAQVQCIAADKAQIAALFDRWNASLATKNPDKVVANYAPDAVLLPTVTNEPRATPADIRDYFVKFLKNSPQGTIDKRIINIGCNVAQDVGTYTFRFGDGSVVKARYTYVYEVDSNGQWLIAHHHSSAMPESK
ncbi:SgcJ/EcaC family oxidoreductase [Roseateles sp. MS654]|uniref:SgcJ/EcaC family oxidoreductase n=1 Tax=Roseateles sp. MS654 TaxID=3412685 RepID=UPI003C2F2249